MKKFIAFAVLAVLGAGVIALFAIDIPAPKQTVERVIPDEQLGQ